MGCAKMRDQTQVDDLFEASYLLCKGFEVHEIQVQGRKRKKPQLSFIFEGEAAKSESNKFKMGRATANVSMLKVSMTHLKDLLFRRLRDLEKGKQQHVWTTKDR